MRDSEIIVDNFAGGGGASTGIELATGRSVDIAINHDPNAIAMHTTNHPNTLHYCESVYAVRPKVATAGRRVALVWSSPDCRHFSKAKGAKPVEKAIRGLAWVTLRWGLDVDPRVMMLENVEEFKTWGPLIHIPPKPDLTEAMMVNFIGPVYPGYSRPDPARIGETFQAFVGMLTTGIPADHPALVECCEFLGIPLDSKDAARLVKGLGYVVEYRELRACDYGAPTIRKRFFMVMRRDGEPIVWPEVTHGDPKSAAVLSGKLAPWRTAAECIDWSIPAPSIFDRKKSLAENTLKRIARGIQRFVIDSPSPFIVKCNHTSSKNAYEAFRGQSLNEPLQTITKKLGYALAVPRLAPFLAGNGGSEYQAKPRPLDKPAHTIMKQSRACLVAPVIARQFGASVGHRADAPSGAITAGGGGKSQLVTANLIKHYGGNYTGPGVSLDEPAHSVTTVDHHAVVASHLVMLRGTCRDGRVVDAPAPGLTAGGQHVGEVKTTLAADGYDEQRAQQTLAFLREYCGEECDGLVTVDGITYRIVDIGMRMLQPHELYRAQGFPEWYIIDQDYTGKKYPKDKQVARCGNAVPPPFAEALVRANLPELCMVRAAA